jgi:two-component system response regulator FlrC
MSRSVVLVVEDDRSLQEALCDTLIYAGYDVETASNGEQALEVLSQKSVQMVVSDVQMAPMDGHELLNRIKTDFPELPVVLITAYGTIQKAVEAIQQGASDYLVKPFEASRLVEMVERLALPMCTPAGLVAVDVKSCDLVNLASRVAATEATVMICGESGTGKEVIARHIHDQSPRANGAFVAINCAAIPENMLEAVLFGYEKGAFTGAYQATPGKFEQAQDGTLLLDEISEMDLGLQAKLLRVLQEREVERLGGRKVIPLNVRVLATSNRNLKEQVAKGAFREDLYYRLNVFPLRLRPLRERTEDIIPLAKSLLARRRLTGQPMAVLTEEACQALRKHPWPGNVRELDNVVQRALILMPGNKVTVDSLQFESVEAVSVTNYAPELADESANLGSDLRKREQSLILDALVEGKGSRKFAAEKLGISPRTLRYKLARLREQGVAIPC